MMAKTWVSKVTENKRKKNDEKVKLDTCANVIFQVGKQLGISTRRSRSRRYLESQIAHESFSKDQNQNFRLSFSIQQFNILLSSLQSFHLHFLNFSIIADLMRLITYIHAFYMILFSETRVLRSLQVSRAKICKILNSVDYDNKSLQDDRDFETSAFRYCTSESQLYWVYSHFWNSAGLCICKYLEAFRRNLRLIIILLIFPLCLSNHSGALLWCSSGCRPFTNFSEKKRDMKLLNIFFFSR